MGTTPKFIQIAVENGYTGPSVITNENLAQIVTSKGFVDAFAKHLWENGKKVLNSRHLASFWEEYDEPDPKLRYGACQWVTREYEYAVSELLKRISSALYRGNVVELLELLSRDDPRKNPFIK